MRKGFKAAGFAASATIIVSMVAIPSTAEAASKGSIKICVKGNNGRLVGAELAQIRGPGHRSGGLRTCRTFGNLSPGYWYVDIDPPEHTYHGDFDAYINVSAGVTKTVTFRMMDD